MTDNKIEELRIMRLKERITQADIANELGHKNYTMFSRIETGVTPLSDDMYNRIKGAIEVITKRKNKNK